MPKLDIKLEIHAPGLDLHQERWNNHVLFLDEVHTHLDRLAACAWSNYQKEGRGALFVDRSQWMQVIRGDDWQHETDQLFPCHYLCLGDIPASIDLRQLGTGFADMIRSYDPESFLVLLVEHYPGDQLSSYLIQADVKPPQAQSEPAAETADSRETLEKR